MIEVRQEEPHSVRSGQCTHKRKAVGHGCRLSGTQGGSRRKKGRLVGGGLRSGGRSDGGAGRLSPQLRPWRASLCTWLVALRSRPQVGPL